MVLFLVLVLVLASLLVQSLCIIHKFSPFATSLWRNVFTVRVPSTPCCLSFLFANGGTDHFAVLGDFPRALPFTFFDFIWHSRLVVYKWGNRIHIWYGWCLIDNR